MATDAKSTEATSAATAPSAKDPSAKERMIAIIESQPADSSYRQLLNELVIDKAIDRGLADVDAGRVVSHEEAVKRIRSWQK
ncbi:MAG: hypothetical protein AAGF31_02130 [Planctomycetota bacterium]